MSVIFVERSHLTTKCRVEGAEKSDVVCIKNGYEGLFVLYAFGIFYMFVAIAIVCDEFFVPALETFVDEFNISMDVAGATFMAAGGSAPELCLSFYGTFKESSVGFRAIVGSAVFNVLFVIAVCAVASREVLTLTWWPLARDSMYYVLSLTTLVICFSVTTPGRIDWWEALLLFLEYIGYCTFMKFNSRAYKFVTSFRETKVMPEVESIESSKSDCSLGKPNALFAKPSTFRQGIVQLLTHNASLCDTAGIAAVTQIAGNLQETFCEVDKDNSGYIDEHELGTLLETLGCKHDSKNIKSAFATINRQGDGKITFDEFKKWYIASEARIEVETRRIFDKFDHDQSGTIERNEIADLLKSLGHHPKEADIRQAIAEILATHPMVSQEGFGMRRKESDSTSTRAGTDASAEEADLGTASSVVPVAVDDDIHVTFMQFDRWYTQSLFWQEQHQQHLCEQEAAGETGFSVDWPEDATLSGLCWYALTYPICISLYATMPDVRRPRNQGNIKVAFAEFFMSLLWIAFFACCLVDWATVASYSVGIPVSVAAVTVLAAGTSIPDLLSSYIVAKQGEGDMAVSSSIGSNIFDVTVGLPLPWLCFTFIRGEPVQVADTRGDSVMVLIIMLVMVITTVKCMSWRMTKSMGYVMFLFYIIFIVQDILHDLPMEDPWLPYIL